MTFGMAGLDLELLSNTDVLAVSMRGPLAAKAFVYVSNGEVDPPLLEISFMSDSVSMFKFTGADGGNRDQLGQPIPLGAADAAEQVVDRIADYLYSFQFTWRGVVTRGTDGHSELSIGGFQAGIATA